MALLDKVCKHNMTDLRGLDLESTQGRGSTVCREDYHSQEQWCFHQLQTVTKRRLYSKIVRIAPQEQREHQQISKCFDIYCSVCVFVLSGANSGNYANYSIGDCGVCCLGLLSAAGENTAGRWTHLCMTVYVFCQNLTIQSQQRCVDCSSENWKR